MQEALTNVLRHAGPTRALVRVGWEDDEVVVQVADCGRGTVQAAPAGGRGPRGCAPGSRRPAAAWPPGPMTAAGSRWWHGAAGRRCQMIRVALADDQPVVRMGLRVLIDREDDLELVGEADDGAPRSSWPGAPTPTSCCWTSACPGWTG